MNINSLAANDERVFKIFYFSDLLENSKINIYSHSGTVRTFKKWGEYCPGHQLAHKVVKGKNLGHADLGSYIIGNLQVCCYKILGGGG